MIKSFRDKNTEKVFLRDKSRRYSTSVQRMALRKMLILDAAESLDELRLLLGHRIKKLSGNRRGQHSIGLNDQWRICFRWSRGHACEVEIADCR
jgi:proteic killer suppression protein